MNTELGQNMYYIINEFKVPQKYKNIVINTYYVISVFINLYSIIGIIVMR